MIDPQVVDYKDKKLIYFFVPASSQVHKTGKKVFDRSVDGDFVVKTQSAISAMYLRKSNSYTENAVYPGLREIDIKRTDHVPEKNNVGELNGGLSGGLNVPVNGALIKNIKESLNASQSKVFDFIMRNPGCMGKEITGALDMPRDTFNKIIRFLFEKKIIERRGSKKTGGYWVKKEPTSTSS